MESAETAATKSIAAKTASAVESAASAEMGVTSVATAKTVASAMVAMEHISEDISENIIHIFTIKMKFLISAIGSTVKSAEAACTCTCARIKEKDAQIKEKDAQINRLLSILEKQ